MTEKRPPGRPPSPDKGRTVRVYCNPRRLNIVARIGPTAEEAIYALIDQAGSSLQGPDTEAGTPMSEAASTLPDQAPPPAKPTVKPATPRPPTKYHSLCPRCSRMGVPACPPCRLRNTQK